MPVYSFFTSYSLLGLLFVRLQRTWFPHPRIYEVLQVLEFSSSRKRMSVIVRNVENQLLLLCKGADRLVSQCLHDLLLHI
jgi:magnesium-transporting ATPase (P-type)